MTSTDSGTSRSLPLALAALGIVFGDIGTSPLYALKACFSGFHAVPVNELNILGVLSLIFWSLTVVISLKYVTFVMRADNRSEGGIIALFSLLPEKYRANKPIMLIAALFGAALLYGDGFITPAISVLSALEGLSVVTSKADAYIIPLTCAVLAGLFLVQRMGTHRIGRIFGPVMLLWFMVLATFGVMHVLRNPTVLAAMNPVYAANFFIHNGRESAIVLGAVVLCITGGEALYADMGHFGRHPIRLAWYFIAMPALLLNYFGQGAMLLTDPNAAASPFYALTPRHLLIPMVALSTCATIIASQAVISGVFSLTRQTIQLGYMPRTQILHTSEESEGQIYCPFANWVMAVICIMLVIQFKSSDNLAGAYGIAITSTMCITTVLFFAYLRHVRKWPWITATLLCSFFMIFDLGFFTANLSKIDGGGWIPLTVAGFICLSMMVWAKGRSRVNAYMERYRLPLEELVSRVESNDVIRTPGTAVFLSASPRGTPPILLHHVNLTGQIKEHIILFSAITEPLPHIAQGERLVVKVLEHGICRVIARYGFAESPDIRPIMQEIDNLGIVPHMEDMVYFLGRESLVTHVHPQLWKSFYAFMSKSSMSPSIYFKIPTERVIEIGMQVEL